MSLAADAAGPTIQFSTSAAIGLQVVREKGGRGVSEIGRQVHVVVL